MLLVWKTKFVQAKDGCFGPQYQLFPRRTWFRCRWFWCEKPTFSQAKQTKAIYLVFGRIVSQKMVFSEKKLVSVPKPFFLGEKLAFRSKTIFCISTSWFFGSTLYRRENKKQYLAVSFPERCFLVSIPQAKLFLIGRAQCCHGVRADVEPERVVSHVLAWVWFWWSLRDTDSGHAGKAGLTFI